MHQPSGDRARPGDRDLLPDDGAHGELEAVGGAGDTASRVAPHQRADERVVPQGLPNGDGIGIEVEQLAAARHGRVQVAQVRQDELALHVGRPRGILCIGRAQRDDAVPMGQAQAARVRAPLELLDSGQGPQPEELEYRGRVEGPPAGEAESNGLGGWFPAGPCSLCSARRPGAQPARSVGERLAHGVVALAHAGEARGEGHVSDREVGRLEQDAGRLAALGPGQRQWPGADLGGDEAVQLAGAVAEAVGQALDALAVDDAVADEAHGPCDGVGPDVPFGRARRGVGPAA